MPELANRQHYELPPEFFRLVLGRQLKYSCCYWPDSVSTLDEAEGNKLLGEAQRTIARDAVNGFLFQLPKLGVWNAELEGLWENSPIQANDLTEVRWRQ